MSSIEKQLIFRQINEDISIPSSAIEKDWRVVQTLALVYQTSAAPYLVFKGGFSLSKVWNIIERFSEDVDLPLSYEFLGFTENSSRTQIGKLRKASFNYISKIFSPEVKLEIGSKTMREPFTNKAFCSFVGEKFSSRNFADNKISIPTVYPKRTFIEKLFLLHED